MPNPKRIIPVSEVKPGDSIGLASGRIDFVVSMSPTVFGGVSIASIDNIYCDARVHGQWTHGATALVTVGYTNRKAKRARGKMARRARKATRRSTILAGFLQAHVHSRALTGNEVYDVIVDDVMEA